MGEDKKVLSRPRSKTMKALFAVCRNRCAFPRCDVVAYDPRSGSVLVEICHIEGNKPGSARYRDDQSDEERQGFDNLMLMCGPHHKVIDDDVVSYTVERLKQMKREHEDSSPDASLEHIAEDVSNKLLANFSAEVIRASTVIVSQNQMGGQTAHTIINKAPPRRHLSKEVTQRLINDLQMLPPRTCEIRRVQGNEEASALATQLRDALKQAGWTIKETVMLASDFRGFEVGLRREGSIPEDVNALVSYLFHSEIMLEPGVIPDPKCETLTIVVGHQNS